MQHLNRSILKDYDVARNAPTSVCAVQFGDDALLLGLVDRLLDDANAKGLNVGMALIQPGIVGYVAQLEAQEGLFTTFVRGDLNEHEVRREQVVQSLLHAYSPDKDDAAIMALAHDAGIRFAILSEDDSGTFAARDHMAVALAARFLAERFRAGLEGMAFIVCGMDAECAVRIRTEVAALASEWNVAPDFIHWLESCRFFPALADCLVSRSTAEEAAHLCAEMNYADAMIHIAEPYGLWAIQADNAFCTEFPMDKYCDQIVFTDDIASAFLKKQRLFDAGLFAMAALGCLHGDVTLADCMKDEPLREQVGRAFFDEILPSVPFDRAEITPYVVSCFERYENPLNNNRILDCARGLVRKFCIGVLPAMRAYEDEHFAPPPQLSMALAAMVLLYSGVRPNAQGIYTVELDGESMPLYEPEEVLHAFSVLAPDMPADSLAYAALADRTLWNGEDLRQIDGLEELLAQNMAMVRFMLARDLEQN